MNESELGDLLGGFTSCAFRFEVRERYNSEVGREAYRKFRHGEPDDYRWHRSWLEKIRRDRESGKSWQRVRIVSVPLSEYSRYGLTVARLSVDAGEDIRYLRRDVAARVGLDPLDAWLLDDRQLVHLLFNDDDTFRGGEIIDDPVVIARHIAWRDLALQLAETYHEFVSWQS